MDDRQNGLDLNDHQTQRELFGVALFTPEELTDLYGVQSDTIKQWIRDKKVAGVRLGRRWFVPDTAIRKSVMAALQEAGLARIPPKRTARPAAVTSNNNQSPALFDTVNEA